MTLRLTDEETELLRRQAEIEHRSMHEVARLALLERIARTQRTTTIREMTRHVLQRDDEAVRLLAE